MSSATNPPSSTTGTATTTATTATKSPARPQALQASPFSYHSLYPSQPIPLRPHPQPPQQGIIYPVASSGRGFMTRPIRPPDLNQQNLNAGASLPRAVSVGYNRAPVGSTQLPHHHHHHHQQHQVLMHPSYQSAAAAAQLMRQHPAPHFVSGGPSLGPIKGVPVTASPKTASSPLPVADSNGYKNTRNRSQDDNIAVIRDRKVRISDEASLYALCRSWLRNGFPEDNQPRYADVVKVLPRPLPIPDDTDSQRKEGEEVLERDEDLAFINTLPENEILKRHIKRAKKVRAGLREKRLKRIERYKMRLAMLLPPPVEQLRNDISFGN